MATPLARSLLFVPGDSQKKIDRAADAGADVLIFDLEDAVEPSAKPAARRLVAKALQQPSASRRFVRINSLQAGMLAEDLGAVMEAPPEVIVLPKCESVDDLQVAAAALQQREAAKAATLILPVVTETARALRNLMRADWSHPRLYGMLWGAEDLSADIGAFTNREGGIYTGVYRLARDLCLLAAREARVLAIDTPYMDVKDDDGCRQEAETAFRAGFDGKVALHPSQVPLINSAFTPGAEQIDWARRVLEALEAQGGGVAVVDGRMIDMPHKRNALRILASIHT